jgi:predicted O-methyltransferase YrrM
MPGNAVKIRLLAYWRALLNRRSHLHLRRNARLYDELQLYLQRTGSTGCNYLDYWELYRAVRKRKPREILECGTGVSTVVLALALKENEEETGVPGRITSLEEEPRYFEDAKSLFPPAYAQYVELVLSPRIEDYYGMFRGVRYRDVPSRPYDFVFIDGPNYLAPTDGSVTFDFDLLHLLRYAEHEVYAIIDKRVTTCFVLQRLLRPGLVRYVARKHLCFVGPASRRDIQYIDPKVPSAAFGDSFRTFGNSTLIF